MTEQGHGWTTPSGQPPAGPPAPAMPPGYGEPPAPPGYGYGYGQPPAYPPPGGYAPPQGYGSPPYGAPGYASLPPWQGGPPPPPAPGVVPLRPLGLGELLDGAVKIIRRYPKPTLGIAALIAAVGTVLNVLVVLGGDYSVFDETSLSGSEDPFSSTGLGSSWTQVPVVLLGLVLGLVLTGALISVVGKAVLGRPTDLAETWGEVRGRFGALIGLALLTGLLAFGFAAAGILLAVLLFVVAGPVSLLLGLPVAAAGLVGAAYVYVRLSLAPAALVLEKCGIRTAMHRSGVLVARSWWRVLGILLLTRLIAYLITQILTVPFMVIGLIGFFSEPSGGSFVMLAVLLQVGAGLASVLVSPFEAGVRALLYVDRRMRAEGLDLTLQAAAASPASA